MEALKTVDQLGTIEPKRDFKAAPWPFAAQFGDDLVQFIYGSCHGLLRVTDGTLGLLAIENEEQGNGQFAEFMELYEQIAKAMYLDASVLEITNDRLYKHLVTKRSYSNWTLPNSDGPNVKKVLL